MRKIVITAGIGYNGKKCFDGLVRSDFANLAAQKDVRERLARLYGGYTEQQSEGGWVQDDVLIREPGIVYTVFIEDSYVSPGDIAEFIRKAFHQDSVVLEVSSPRVEFVEGKPDKNTVENWPTGGDRPE